MKILNRNVIKKNNKRLDLQLWLCQKDYFLGGIISGTAYFIVRKSVTLVLIID